MEKKRVITKKSIDIGYSPEYEESSSQESNDYENKENESMSPLENDHPAQINSKDWKHRTPSFKATGRIEKRKRRYRPGTKALMEIRKFQKSTRQLIPQAPFNRLCKEIIQEIAPNREHRIQSEAITALQEASEAFLVTFFEAANRCAIHARRVTVTPADFNLLRWILNAFGINWV